MKRAALYLTPMEPNDAQALEVQRCDSQAGGDQSNTQPPTADMVRGRQGWIAVDLDGTLAEHSTPPGIGAPIPMMVDRVKEWLSAGKDVRLFTARSADTPEKKSYIESWMKQHLGTVLPITNTKDGGMIEHWDDKAVRVQQDTGIPVSDHKMSRQASEDLVSMVTGIRLPTPDHAASAWDQADLPEWARGKNLVKATKPLAVMPTGIAKTNDGRVFVVDARAKRSLLEKANGRQNPLPLTRLHEEGDVRNAGYGMGLNESGGYLYGETVCWAESAARDISNGDAGPVSPEMKCEPLDPITHEVLTPDSPLYAGVDENGKGKGYFGSKYKTNTFRPMELIVMASLVTVAAFDLPLASLGAERNTPPPAAATTRKENGMNPKLKKLLGLADTASPELCTQMLSHTRSRLGLGEDATEEQVLEKLTAMLDSTATVKCGVCEAPMAAGTQFCGSCGQKAGSKKTPPPSTEEILAKAAKAGEDSAQAAWKANEAKKEADEFETQILAAEKDGRITGEKDGIEKEREFWRGKFKLDAARAKKELDDRQKAGEWFRNSPIESGGQDASLNVDRHPRKQAEQELSRAAAWNAQCGRAVADFPKSLADVLGGDSGERAFHAAVIRSDPGWGTNFEEFGHRAGRHGEPWMVDIQSKRNDSDLAVAKDYDPEKVARLRTDALKAFREKKISTDVMSAEDQRAAMFLIERQTAGDQSNFQPPTRFGLPFAIGPVQGLYAADEIAPPITGGVNEEASYPIYGNESLQATVGQDGYPIPVAYKAEDIEESSLNNTFQKVTLLPYANMVRVDRRSQLASVVLPYGFLADATMQALAIEKNKREVYVQKMCRTTANYNALNQYALTGARQWDQPSSTPLKDLRLGNAQVMQSVGMGVEAWLIPYDPLTALTYHPDFIKFSQIADTGTGRPDGYASINHITAVLGPIISPTARISTRHGGTAPTFVWGTDVIGFVSNRGALRAPRSFANVVAAGAPVTMTEQKRLDGYIGVDFVKVSDMYQPQVAGVGNSGQTVTTPTVSAFIFTTASAAQGSAAL